MWTETKLEQPENILLVIVYKLLLIIAVFALEQLSNAPSPVEVTLSGITISVKPVHS